MDFTILIIITAMVLLTNTQGKSRFNFYFREAVLVPVDNAHE